MHGHACYHVGRVSEGDQITINRGEREILSASMSELRESWKGALGGGER